MIITARKTIDVLFEYLGTARKIVLLGCAQCAADCGTGGAEQLEEFEDKLKDAGRETLARLVLDPACHAPGVRQALKGIQKELAGAEAVICFSCGDGTQVVAKMTGDIPVYPGNDTLFLGETVRSGEYVEACRACGECELGWTGGICPVTHCAKSLLNGPCGGSKGRQCEVNQNEECVWLRIYDRLEAIDQLDNLLEIRPPRAHLKNVHPRHHSTRKYRNTGAEGMGNAK